MGVIALSALFVPGPLVVVTAAVLGTAALMDALAVRTAPRTTTAVPTILSRGVAGTMTVRSEGDLDRGVRYRQAAPPDVVIDPQEREGELVAEITALRRGRHVLPAPAARRDGPLGLGRWYHRPGSDTEVVVYPDLPAARKLALAVRKGRFGELGRRTRGPLDSVPTSTRSAITSPTTTFGR